VAIFGLNKGRSTIIKLIFPLYFGETLFVFFNV